MATSDYVKGRARSARRSDRQPSTVLHPDYAKMIISKIPRKTDNESHMQKRRAVSVLIAGIVVELSDRDMLATDGFEHLDPDILSALVEYKVEKWSLEKSEVQRLRSRSLWTIGVGDQQCQNDSCHVD